MPRRVLLTDFGLAKNVRTESRYTRTGETLGTPSYMSPELARGEFGALAPASDVWALACVLQELLTGRPAFDGDTTAALIGRVVMGRATPLGLAATAVPREVRQLLDACLTVPVRVRPADAGALRDDLDRVRRGERPRARRPGRRRWLAAAAMAILAALATAWWWPARPTRGAEGSLPAPRRVTLPPPDPRIQRAEALATQALANRFESPRAGLDGLAAALALAPDRDDWRIERGLIAWWLTNSTEAHAEWSAVQPMGPQRPLATAYRAVLRWLDHDRDGVLALLPEFETAGGVPGALARVLRAADREDLEAARAAMPHVTDPLGAVLLGRLELHAPQSDPLAAIRAFDLALARGEPNLWALSDRGRARVLTGDADGAVADFRRAAAILPERANLRVNLAHALLRVGRAAEALAELDAFLAENPTHPQALTLRAGVYYELQRHREAIADLDAALAAHPGHPDAARNRADCRQLLGDFDGAMADLDLAIASHPDDFRAWNNRGALRLRLGDAPGAVADYARAVELDPREWVSRNSLGMARWRADDVAGAEAEFRAALARDPDYATARANLGLLCYRQERWAEAATHFRHLLSVAGDDPRFGEVRDLLADCERRLGEAR